MTNKTLKEQIVEIIREHIGKYGVIDYVNRQADQILAIFQADKQELIELVEALPTGTFDSTPFKEILLDKLKAQVNKEK